MTKTFVGIGAGPIQTGIFVAGAAESGFDRIVLVDVDESLVAAVREAKSLTVNTARRDHVATETCRGIEMLHPDADRAALLDVVADATALCTALPTTRLYSSVAPWLREAFSRQPHRSRYIYTAENSTTAAHDLAVQISSNGTPFKTALSNTHYLDTVIGKMSQVFSVRDVLLPPLVPGSDRGHLVEEFHTIYTSCSSDASEMTTCEITTLIQKRDLRPFEEAKLYGHNAVHLLLALLASDAGCHLMSEVRERPDLVTIAEAALLEECGAALRRRFAGSDPFFEPDRFAAWGRELIDRMMLPTLGDRVERVVRDLDRKLGWDDRLIGAIRLCRAEGVEPHHLLRAAQRALALCPNSHNIAAQWGNSAEAKELRALLCISG